MILNLFIDLFIAAHLGLLSLPGLHLGLQVALSISVEARVSGDANICNATACSELIDVSLIWVITLPESDVASASEQKLMPKKVMNKVFILNPLKVSGVIILRRCKNFTIPHLGIGAKFGNTRKPSLPWLASPSKNDINLFYGFNKFNHIIHNTDILHSLNLITI